MNTTFCKAAVTCGIAFASASLALAGAMPASASSSALIIGGIGAGTMGDSLMAPLLGGQFKNETRVNVTWPAQAGPITGKKDKNLGDSIDIGVTNLTAAMNTALKQLSRDANGNVINGEKVTIVGLSAGSLVVNEVMRNMVSSGQLPDPDDIEFIVVEDSSRQELIKNSTKYSAKLNYTYQPAPVTPYDVVVITGEYDGFADFPDRPWNALAVANAMAGAIVVHVPVMYGGLGAVPAKNITVETNAKGGTTTHYLVPTATLPLVQLNPKLKSQEAALKAKIDAGYSRNDKVGATPAKLTALDAPVVDTPTPQAEPTPKSDAATRREARASHRAEVKAAKRDARTAAKATRAAQREERKAARADA
ncbi:PE-PPE domain-containing protein [Mycobacterium sp. PSTR-4-N]|uniref:PE-PPE domain-containing protein n=1 Tax=Mycobacterium sp. PSTR-4-N TaxID=2917745 RepID=UPI001F151037|nr:PE-PPE domain-containing protein [Mycobacterium sp. PSTR-4-N]MCG7595267.1 PE-PPE domain-containing protein [Mycobacterium sp. PSTR-4-N]